MTKIVTHPLNGRSYFISRLSNKIRLSWCTQRDAYGIKSWFSDRIWVINGKVEIIL